ncbi:MAG: CHAT domain-containing protein [Bryobacteraceae bacterium]
MPIPATLHLTVADYRDAHHWYWRLTDAQGHFLADQEVQLNPADSEYEGFLDLPVYLATHSALDRRRDDEARLVRQVGEWMGRNFYGPIGDKILAAGTPAIVRVRVPPDAAGLLYRPWELGYVQGQPLAVQDVSLVFELAGESPRVNHAPVSDRLRVLAVFSLPVDASALNLRQERYQLSRSIRAIGQQNRAIELRVLQYGVTRAALEAMLQEGEGWDVVHFSGHGLAAHLILEKADGKLDKVPSNEFVKLLRPTRGRLKWVTLSACLSAAATVEETLRWLGVEPHRETAPAAGTRELQTVAQALVESLDCAVLAMRYPVGDQFAIDLGRSLYEGVLARNQSLARALQLTLPRLIHSPDVDAAAVATPALFGRGAAVLALDVPEGKAPLRLGLSHFPSEPERLVGRVGLLTQARNVIAPESSYTGVLFHGMSGGGKTACALELAYLYEDIDRFQHFVWFEAPKEGHDISTALASFATRWDIQLDPPEVSLVSIANNDEAAFSASLPRLSRFLEQRSVLVVVDYVESLLRENGSWRDPRWEKLIAALLDHRGHSRLVLTSRVRPQPLHSRMLALPVHSLSLPEAALLARQTPNLGALLRNPAHRPLVIRMLELVQGHPELLKLAEAQATSPERLSGHLDRAQQAATVGAEQLRAFFETGESKLEPRGFLEALNAWTRSVSGSLAELARLLFHRLCCLEEEDREEGIIKIVWGDVSSEMRELVDAGLVDAAYRIHPGVAEAGREQAGPELRAGVDGELAKLWTGVFSQALEKEGAGMGPLILRAGRGAVPYLMRQHRWEDAATLLERVIQRDNAPRTLTEVLPLLQRIAEATEGTAAGLENGGIFASALADAGRLSEAEAALRKVEQQAVNLADYRLASSVAGDLTNLLWRSGHVEEALATVERMKDYTRRAGLGPWTQLSGECQRLQILNSAGRWNEVLAAVQRWREEIRSWPESGGKTEAVEIWNVREGLLDTAGTAAMRLERWEDALALNEECVGVTKSRGATAVEIARTRFNGCGPLLRLQRYPDARRLLLECLAVFESAAGAAEIGAVQSSLARLESCLQHFPQAVGHENAALRFKYSGGSPADCAISHFNLANYLTRANAEWRLVLAHRFASALIRYQTSDGRFASVLDALRIHLAEVNPSDVPASFDEVCRLVEQTEGVRFRDLFARLPQRAPSGDEALRIVLEMARAAEP